MAAMLVLLVVLATILWLQAARPQPVKVRRNLTPQEIRRLHAERRRDF